MRPDPGSLSGPLGLAGNLHRVKEGNDNAPVPLAMELSHRDTKLMTLGVKEGCAHRGCETAAVQRGSVSRLEMFPVPACIFTSSRSCQQSSQTMTSPPAQELLCLRLSQTRDSLKLKYRTDQTNWYNHNGTAFLNIEKMPMIHW